MIQVPAKDMVTVEAREVLDPCGQQCWYERKGEILRVASIRLWGARWVKVTVEDGRSFVQPNTRRVFIRGRL
jgi:hypothetical protein